MPVAVARSVAEWQRIPLKERIRLLEAEAATNRHREEELLVSEEAPEGMGVLDALLGWRPIAGELVSLLKSATGRALGPENLITREEARRELRCSSATIDAILKRVKPFREGRPTLYLWRDVLAAAGSYRDEKTKRARRASGPRVNV